MKLSHLLWMIIIAGMLLMFACKTTTDPDPEDTMITLTGIVSDEVSNRPIENAVIRVLNYSPETTAITDINGAYSLELTVKESRELNLTAFKETFLQDTVAVLATPGRDVSVPLFSLTPTISTPVASGSAASLYLFSQSAPFIGVKESGSAESAQLVFEVVDSSGIPLDLTNKVNVRFRLGASPAGAYLNPSTATCAT